MRGSQSLTLLRRDGCGFTCITSGMRLQVFSWQAISVSNTDRTLRNECARWTSSSPSTSVCANTFWIRSLHAMISCAVVFWRSAQMYEGPTLERR